MKSTSKPRRPPLPIALALASVFAAAATAHAQGLSADEMETFGGTYSADCANPAAPRLRVTRDALLVEQGNQRMTGGNVIPQYAYFGNSSPPGFLGALVSEVRGGAQLSFLGYTDKAGLFLKLEGDTKVTAALGPALAKPKYRRCDGSAAAPLAVAPAAPPPATGKTAGAPNLAMVVVDPKFQRLYRRALGAKAAQPWLARLNGPSPEPRAVTVEGAGYVLISACKDHDCYDHNVVLLYSAEQERVLGLIQENGVKTLIGAPSASLAGQLDRLWQKEYRQK